MNTHEVHDPRYYRDDLRCFVQSCGKFRRDNPNTKFLTVPRSLKEIWCKSLNRNCPKRDLYVCEEHINIEEDCYTRGHRLCIKPSTNLMITKCNVAVQMEDGKKCNVSTLFAFEPTTRNVATGAKKDKGTIPDEKPIRAECGIMESDDPLETRDVKPLLFCRGCAAVERPLHPLQRTLAAAYGQLTGTTVSESDIYPKLLCSYCRALLVKFAAFKKKCRSVQTTLFKLHSSGVPITLDAIKSRISGIPYPNLTTHVSIEYINDVCTQISVKKEPPELVDLPLQNEPCDIVLNKNVDVTAENTIGGDSEDNDVELLMDDPNAEVISIYDDDDAPDICDGSNEGGDISGFLVNDKTIDSRQDSGNKAAASEIAEREKKRSETPKRNIRTNGSKRKAGHYITTNEEYEHPRASQMIKMESEDHTGSAPVHSNIVDVNLDLVKREPDCSSIKDNDAQALTKDIHSTSSARMPNVFVPKNSHFHKKDPKRNELPALKKLKLEKNRTELQTYKTEKAVSASGCNRKEKNTSAQKFQVKQNQDNTTNIVRIEQTAFADDMENGDTSTEAFDSISYVRLEGNATIEVPVEGPDSSDSDSEMSSDSGDQPQATLKKTPRGVEITECSVFSMITPKTIIATNSPSSKDTDSKEVEDEAVMFKKNVEAHIKLVRCQMKSAIPEGILLAYEKRYNVKVVRLCIDDQIKQYRARMDAQRRSKAAFKCKHCPQWFLLSISLTKHMAQHHDPVHGRYVCEICAARYRLIDNLHKHTQNTHMYDFICNECDFISKSADAARNHFQRHKDGSRAGLSGQLRQPALRAPRSRGPRALPGPRPESRTQRNVIHIG